MKEYEQLTKFIVAGHQQGWISIDDEKAEASDMLETADTSRDDLRFYHILQELQGTLKLLHILMDGVMHIYKWHLNIGYALKKMTLSGQQRSGLAKMGVESILIYPRYRGNSFCL